MFAAERTEGVPDWPWLHRDEPASALPKLRYLDCRAPVRTVISTVGADDEAIIGAIVNCLPPHVWNNQSAQSYAGYCYAVTTVEDQETVEWYNGHLQTRGHLLRVGLAMALTLCTSHATAATVWCGASRGVIDASGPRENPGELPSTITFAWTDLTCAVVRPLIEDPVEEPFQHLPTLLPHPRHAWSQRVLSEADALSEIAGWVGADCRAIEVVRDGVARVLANFHLHRYECGMSWGVGHIPTAQHTHERVVRAQWLAPSAEMAFGPPGTVGGVRLYTGVGLTEHMRDAEGVITESILWLEN